MRDISPSKARAWLFNRSWSSQLATRPVRVALSFAYLQCVAHFVAVKSGDSRLFSDVGEAVDNELGGARSGGCVVCEAVKIEVELLARKSHFRAKNRPSKQP
jgi:hypothetical protein